MKMVGVERRGGMVHIDGFSDKKTLKAAIRDLAKTVAKYNKSEAEGLVYIDVDHINEMPNLPNEFYLEAQEVNCASTMRFLDGDKNNFDQKNVIMEYDDGRWYLYVRFAE